ncbi:hypothetical protein [Paraflavitalea pollutisoli]|uniref:hypothetical protein n=1 Tax=Paraflavitalea pollutisoli TaxID=3034143 RepID=UPI0023EAEB74|nr:hypothetical protein [Paraflavitalea sp. H1-2-19X]
MFAAIVTTLSPKKGVAIDLFAFVMFMGYGWGSLAFSLLIDLGLNETFQLFGILAAGGALLAMRVFRQQR